MFRQCYAVMRQTNEFDIVSVHADKTSAYETREEIVFNYVTDKDGCSKGMIPRVYAEADFVAKQATLSDGHYITRDTKTDLAGLAVWLKTSTVTKGWTGQTVAIKCTKLFTITVVCMSKEVMPKYRCISYIEPYDVEMTDEELVGIAYRNSKLYKSRSFVRLRRALESDTASKTLTVSRLRHEFSSDYTKCPFAKVYTPRESNVPQQAELNKEVVAKHTEMQKKKVSFGASNNLEKVDSVSDSDPIKMGSETTKVEKTE